MTRADLEAAAEEKYPDTEWSSPATMAALREVYIRGRLDQAEADAQLADGYSEEVSALCSDAGYPASESWVVIHYRGMYHGARDVAIRIRKGVE